jgi:two-component system, NtrC family, nitrogen regulation sensor histidine kinase NtrY
MKLNTRLILVVLVVSWVPLGVVTGVLSVRTESNYQASHEAQRAAAVRAVGGELSRTIDRIDAALANVARSSFLDISLLQPLEHGAFYSDSKRQRAVMLEAKRLVSAADVETLHLFDLEEGGRGIALGHRTGIQAADPTIVSWARGRPGTAKLRRDTIDGEAGAVEDVWTLQVVRVIGDRVAIVGGRVLSVDWLKGLLTIYAGGTFAALEDPGGAVLEATYDVDAPPSADDFDLVLRPVRGGAARGEIGTLRLYIDRGPLAKAVRELWVTAGGVALLSALLALCVGWWTSRRLARPLERLAAAAGAIASGARDERVPEVSGRDEVATLTNAFNQMTEELSESEDRLRHAERIAAWQQIAQRIAHEIKNPLFPIQMSIETLQKVHERKHPDFEEVFEESTRTILEEVERMGRIVTEFRDFARLPVPHLEVVDLASILKSVVVLHQGVTPDVEVQWDGPEELLVTVDADQMTAVATNLVKNAIEAHGLQPASGARVLVRLRDSEGGGVAWSVEDNGSGMPDEVRAKLFTPYFTTKSSGTGLGLAITHRIVIEHQGRINAVSEVGKGTQFMVQLPKSSAP